MNLTLHFNSGTKDYRLNNFIIALTYITFKCYIKVQINHIIQDGSISREHKNAISLADQNRK